MGTVKDSEVTVIHGFSNNSLMLGTSVILWGLFFGAGCRETGLGGDRRMADNPRPRVGKYVLEAKTLQNPDFLESYNQERSERTSSTMANTTRLRS